ncbi:MAG: flagellar protein FlgN [Fimbriimonadaceae bacterium]|nr:flagellar protein FlgN [Fimbriimonadaceae bacterium]
MASKTKDIQRLWWDWLGTSERLLRSLSEQTRALVTRDVSRIEALQPELETMLSRMRIIDDHAAAAAAKLAEDLGTEPTLRGITAALSETEAQQVRSIANRVRVVARNVEEMLDKNRTLIENELTYVNGSLALIAKASTERDGRYSQAQGGPIVLDQVA